MFSLICFAKYLFVRLTLQNVQKAAPFYLKSQKKAFFEHHNDRVDVPKWLVDYLHVCIEEIGRHFFLIYLKSVLALSRIRMLIHEFQC